MTSMTLEEFSSCRDEQFETRIDLHKYDDEDVFGGKRFGLFAFRKK